MTEPGLIYMASAYSHNSATVRRERYEFAVRSCALLVLHKFQVFSPIAQSHPLIDIVPELGGGGWDNWKEYDQVWLCRSAEMWIAVDGDESWRDSVGVRAEAEFMARELGRPCHLFYPLLLDERNPIEPCLVRLMLREVG